MYPHDEGIRGDAIARHIEQLGKPYIVLGTGGYEVYNCHEEIGFGWKPSIINCKTPLTAFNRFVDLITAELLCESISTISLEVVDNPCQGCTYDCESCNPFNKSSDD